MIDKAIFTANFSNIKTVTSRSVMQLILEVDISMADAVLERLGGMPQPGKERPVTVFRMVDNGSGNENTL